MRIARQIVWFDWYGYNFFLLIWQYSSSKTNVFFVKLCTISSNRAYNTRILENEVKNTRCRNFDTDFTKKIFCPYKNWVVPSLKYLQMKIYDYFKAAPYMQGSKYNIKIVMFAFENQKGCFEFPLLLEIWTRGIESTLDW